MKSIVIIAFFGLLVSCYAQTQTGTGAACSDTNGSENIISFSCSTTSATIPFCVGTTPGNNTRCTQCRPGNNCDCPTGQYCSSLNGNTRGTCKTFAQQTKSCINYDIISLSNSTFPAAQKCADFQTDNTTITFDFIGSCIEAICQFCDPLGGTQGCSSTTGLLEARTCVEPGIVTIFRSSPWAPTVYYEDRVAVWMAVFFPLLVFATFFLAYIAYKSCTASS